MITFSNDLVKGFKRTNKNLRYGQEFFNYAKLEKVVDKEDKSFCDKLYFANDATAKQMIKSRMDSNGWYNTGIAQLDRATTF